MSKSCLLSFSFQIYFESSVSFEYLLWLKDLMWFLYRSFQCGFYIALFNDGKPWTKKDSNSLFDVTMGSYDGAEICELVGLFILNKLGQKFGKENIGLYRDDGLAIMKNKSARLADKTRKELHKCFEQFGLKITAEANLHVVNFLDVTFDLNKFKPYTGCIRKK